MAKFYFYPPKSAGATQYYKDGSLTSVGIDTVTPGNSNPLPVLVLDSAGVPFDWTDLAQEATLLTRASEATQLLNLAQLTAANVSLTSIAAEDFATETTLAALFAKFGTLGQKNMAGSAPVVLASDQSAIPVSQSGAWSVSVSNFPATQAVTQSTSPWVVSGTVAISGAVAVTQSTSPWVVSGTVAAAQSGNWSTRTQDGSGNDITSTSNALDVNVKNASIAVTGTFFQATQPISATALPLPTGAATETTLAAISGKLPATLGQKTMANSLAVVLASDQSAIPITGSITVAATVWKEKYRLDFSSTNVTTGAYVQLVASTTNAVTEFEIYNTTTETLILATGAAAAEVDKFYIMPGGNLTKIGLSVAASTRLSLKAVTATADTGYINVNLFG